MTTFYRSARGKPLPGLPSQQFFNDYEKALHELNQADKEVAAPIVNEIEDLAAAAADEIEELAQDALDEVADLAGSALDALANAVGDAAKPVLIPIVEIGLIALLGLIVVEKFI